MRNRAIHIQPRKFLGALLLLAIYMAAFVHGGIEHFHHHSHHNHELHDEGCEEDACHRTIYHGDRVTGCQHKAHFVPTLENCLTCHELFVQRDAGLLDETTQEWNPEHPVVPQTFHHLFTLNTPRLVSNKGPPHLA